MTKTITKAGVIKALKTEKIARGAFFYRSTHGWFAVGCTVCAVGAVLRHMSFETWARKKDYDLNGMGEDATNGHYWAGPNSSPLIVKQALIKKNYLGALSMYFESGKRVSQCIAFVKKNFPPKLSITLR